MNRAVAVSTESIWKFLRRAQKAVKLHTGVLQAAWGIVMQGDVSATQSDTVETECDLERAAVHTSAVAVLDMTWLVWWSARPVVKMCAARCEWHSRLQRVRADCSR